MARTVKRTRTRLRPAPFLVLGLLLNIAGGLSASRLTVLRKIRVNGAASWDEARIASILAGLRGKPCATINRYTVESLVLRNQEVRSAHFDRNPFGSAVLTVGYRNPVARFYNRGDLALSSEGDIYVSDHVPDDLPTLQLGDDEPKPLLTLANDWPTLPIANLAAKVKELNLKQTLRIEYGTGSSLCLNIGAGKAILGSCDQLDEKLRVLNERLTTDPDYLLKISNLNLVDPSNPMVVKK